MGTRHIFDCVVARETGRDANQSRVSGNYGMSHTDCTVIFEAFGSGIQDARWNAASKLSSTWLITPLASLLVAR